MLSSTLRSLLLRRLPSIPKNPNPNLSSILPHFSSTPKNPDDDDWDKPQPPYPSSPDPLFGGEGGGGGLDWGGEVSSWSTGLTKDHFDGASVGHQVTDLAGPSPESPKQILAAMDEEEELLRMVEKDNKNDKTFVDSWKERLMETYKLLKQVREPGARGEYLKDSEKAEMYRLHKENPEEYSIERLAKDYRIMRQRVHAILWLKEMEEEEEKRLGKPLDDSVEILLDNFPETGYIRTRPVQQTGGQS